MEDHVEVLKLAVQVPAHCDLVGDGRCGSVDVTALPQLQAYLVQQLQQVLDVQHLQQV